MLSRDDVGYADSTRQRWVAVVDGGTHDCRLNVMHAQFTDDAPWMADPSNTPDSTCPLRFIGMDRLHGTLTVAHVPIIVSSSSS